MTFRAWLVTLVVLLSSALLTSTRGVAQGRPAPADDGEQATASAAGESLPLLVDVELSSEAITVGDRLTATLMIVWMGEETTEPARFPTWQDTWGRAEVLEVGEPTEVDDASGRRIWRQELELTAFRPGDVELPSVTVALPLSDRTVEANTQPATFTVGSVLPEPPDDPSSRGVGQDAAGQAAPPPIPEPKGPAGAVELQQAQRNFWLTSGALWLSLLIGLVWTAVAVANQPEKVATRAEKVDPLRMLSPLDELKERLARLDPAATEPLHTGLSFALRNYLGRRLHFRAVESTTTEIQRALRRAALSADVHHRVVRLLRDADAVKFARAEVAQDVARRRVVEVGDLAREIEHEMAPTQRLDPSQSRPVSSSPESSSARRVTSQGNPAGVGNATADGSRPGSTAA